MTYHKGHNNPNWKGGRRLRNGKYYMILKPDHIFCDSMGYVMEHRLVYEEYYNCCLLPITLIHHKDENTKNNNINNLEPLYIDQHSKVHDKPNKLHKILKQKYLEDLPNRKCFDCGSKTTYKRKNGNPVWLRINNNWYCAKCHRRITYQQSSLSKPYQ